MIKNNEIYILRVPSPAHIQRLKRLLINILSLFYFMFFRKLAENLLCFENPQTKTLQ